MRLQPLATPRLHLRALADDDAQAVAALMTPEVSRWLATWPSPITSEFALSRIREARGIVERGEGLHYAIEHHGNLIGWVRVDRSAHDRRTGDLGYWLGEPYQAQGFIAEALREVVTVAFSVLDLDLIEAGAQTGNIGSFKVMRQLGMRESHERMVFAAARSRNELCVYFRIQRNEMRSDNPA